MTKINALHSKAMSVSTDKYWWIGMTESEGTFKFDSNGEKFPFLEKQSPWGGNEPGAESSDICAIMLKENLEIHDYSCNHKLFSICESTSIPPGNIAMSKIGHITDFPSSLFNI